MTNEPINHTPHVKFLLGRRPKVYLQFFFFGWTKTLDLAFRTLAIYTLRLKFSMFTMLAILRR